MKSFIRVLLASIRNLTIVDGYQSWREREHESLSKLVQARLNALENPSKACVDVERLSCRLMEICGYGCQIHRALRCFLIAYALGRTMILISSIFPCENEEDFSWNVSDGWSYNAGGFEEIYQPISEVCDRSLATNASSWGKIALIEEDTSYS